MTKEKFLQDNGLNDGYDKHRWEIAKELAGRVDRSPLICFQSLISLEKRGLIELLDAQTWENKVKEMSIPVTLDNGKEIMKPLSTFSLCPKCGNQSVRGKELEEGGGVKCIKCDYWECY